MLKEMGKIRRKENKKATARRTREKTAGIAKRGEGGNNLLSKLLSLFCLLFSRPPPPPRKMGDDGKRLPKNETAGLCRSQRSGEEKSRRSGGGRKFRP